MGGGAVGGRPTHLGAQAAGVRRRPTVPGCGWWRRSAGPGLARGRGGLHPGGHADGEEVGQTSLQPEVQRRDVLDEEGAAMSLTERVGQVSGERLRRQRRATHLDERAGGVGAGQMEHGGHGGRLGAWFAQQEDGQGGCGGLLDEPIDLLQGRADADEAEVAAQVAAGQLLKLMAFDLVGEMLGQPLGPVEVVR